MSMRYQAGIVLPGYNALKVANAPTIGTATNAGSTSISVAFTAPACVGGGAISSYTAFANCGLYTASGASSPLTVTGLTTGTAYTFKVIAANAYGPSYPSASSNSATPAAIAGQQAYTTAGTFSWVAPAGVTKVSVVAVGGGAYGTAGGFTSCCTPRGGSGGGGGGLAYTNNVTVIPGNSYSVVVGDGSNGPANCSSFNSTTTKAGGSNQQCGGTFISGTSGANGGQGGGRTCYAVGAGGGAAGYSGNGGRGQGPYGAGTAGSGGGGGGGAARASASYSGSGGGGVGLLGQGSNGATGCNVSLTGGGGGSCGANGSNGAYGANGGAGGLYGGGGGGGAYAGGGYSGGAGKNGAVRIIWPGNTRSFPSTCTGNL